MFLRISLALLWLLAVCTAPAQRLSPLAQAPDWTQLEAYQETITREDFVHLLEGVFAPGDAAKGLIRVEADSAVIKTTLTPAAEFRLRFAPDAAHAKPTPRFWKKAAELGPAPSDRPLAGVKVAIDPGHLGGAWARMEERFYQIGDTVPVAEGDMTLRVAQLLAPQLRALGAEVVLVRDRAEPTTPLRPDSFREIARAQLAAQGVPSPQESYVTDGFVRAERIFTVQWQSEFLFLRNSEIGSRAKLVNESVRPDLIICLHFNAEEWGEDTAHPEFVPRNHLHLLVIGCYAAVELREDDIRFEMLRGLLEGIYPEELAVSEQLAASLAAATNLPPYSYTTTNALRVGQSPYVWARNLLANRLYHAPVLYVEPYVMNNEEVWERVQAGDYEGERLVAGAMRKSLFREYADGVTAGLRESFAARRR